MYAEGRVQVKLHVRSLDEEENCMTPRTFRSQIGRLVFVILLVEACVSTSLISPQSARLGPDRWQAIVGDLRITGPESRVCFQIARIYKALPPDSTEAELINETTGAHVAVWGTFFDSNEQTRIPEVQFVEELATHAKTLCFRLYKAPLGTAFTRIELKASDTLSVSNITWWSGSVRAP